MDRGSVGPRSTETKVLVVGEGGGGGGGLVVLVECDYGGDEEAGAV